MAGFCRDADQHTNPNQVYIHYGAADHAKMRDAYSGAHTYTTPSVGQSQPNANINSNTIVDSKCIYVGNLPLNASEANVRMILEQFGTIHALEVKPSVRLPRTSFAFVEFTTEEAASRYL